MIIEVMEPGTAFGEVVSDVLGAAEVKWRWQSPDIASDVNMPKVIALEMHAVASCNHRVKRPQVQVAISWGMADTLTKEGVGSTIAAVAEVLGLSGCQWVAAFHDAARPKASFVACRVHPVTLGAVAGAYSWYAVRTLARSLEVQRGWQSSRFCWKQCSHSGCQSRRRSWFTQLDAPS
jgi:hypothetical protein